VKTGNAQLCRAPFFPAIAAIRFNAPIRALAKPLRSRCKAKMTVVAAEMRKLLTLRKGSQVRRAVQPSLRRRLMAALALKNPRCNVPGGAENP
jgi:hypothetical protein